MKIMQLTGIRAMEMREVPAPQIRQPHDVLIRMAAVGVCGSDVHYYLHGRVGSQVVQYPYAEGHEGAGVVAAVGPGVTRVKPGDRVAIEPAMPCHACDQCLVGRHHTCRKLRFLGCPGQAEGCLAEYLVMPDECCFPVPPAMTIEEAALVEPLSIGVYAAQQAPALAGKRVAILGSGPIGLCVMMSARTRGVEKVYMTDKIPARLQVAQRMGANWTGNPDTQDVVKDVLAREKLQLDVVFECCGEQSALDQGVDLLKPGGTLVVVGIPAVDRISFSIDSLRRRELSVVNIRRQNHCVQPALDAIAARNIPAAQLITHRFPFARGKDAFDLVAAYADGVVKAMVLFG